MQGVLEQNDIFEKGEHMQDERPDLESNWLQQRHAERRDEVFRVRSIVFRGKLKRLKFIRFEREY